MDHFPRNASGRMHCGDSRETESIFVFETGKHRLYGFFMLTILKLTLGITIAGSFIQRILS